MHETWDQVLKEQGRGIAGALLVVGVSVLYTMESWWLAWELPMPYLFVYAFVGLAGISVLTRNVDFRSKQQNANTESYWRTFADFSELVLQSLVTAYLVLLLYGMLDFSDGPVVAVRLGLFLIVPLGMGAALANVVLRESEDSTEQTVFPKNVAVFTLGALFVVFPLAPTQEMAMIASYMGWTRAALAVVASLTVSYLILYELEFRGQEARVRNRSKTYKLGAAFVTYAIAVAVSTVLLIAFGHMIDTTASELVQKVIVLAFPGAIGASAGEVVL